MGEDEARTLAALAELRQKLFEPVVTNRGGKVIKRMGDGWIVEYPNIAEATASAIEVQEGLSNHKIIQLRIGVHIGDVTFQDDDIYGDGINVAARLEALADPGQILISDTAHYSLDGKAAARFSGGDQHQLKNIARPVAIWHWPADAKTSAALSSATATMKSGVITNLLLIDEFGTSGSQEAATEIAEELQYDLTLILSRRTGLKVVSQQREDIIPYYVLGGRVRVSGENVRIDIVLSDTKKGTNIWTERFSGNISDTDTVVTNASIKVSGFIRSLTTAFTGAEYRDIPDEDLSVSELLSKSAHLIQLWDQQNVAAGQKSLEYAVSQSPQNPMALAMLASTFTIPVFSGYGSIDDVDVQKVMELANKAVKVGPTIDFVFHARACVKCFLLNNLAGAKADCERALKINPYFHVAQIMAGIIDVFSGETTTGIRKLQEILIVVPEEPMIPIVNTIIAIGCLMCGDGNKALHFAQEGYELSPSNPIGAAVYLAAAPENPEDFKNLIHKLNLKVSIVKNLPFSKPEDIKLFTSLLQAAGLPK